MPTMTMPLISTKALLLICALLPSTCRFASALRPSPGCQSETKLETGNMENITIVVDHFERDFLLYLPTAHNGRDPLSLVLNFHGTPSTADLQWEYTEMDVNAEANGYVLVFPNGFEQGFNAGICCVDHDLDDEAFARAIVEYVAQEACLDLDKVYATGWSNGAYMAYYLACRASDVFSAIAPVAGVIAVDPWTDCNPENPSRVLHFHEIEDWEVDYCGVLQDDYVGAQELVALFAEKQGCSGELGVSYSQGEVVCRSHRDCPPGKNATLCTLTRNRKTHSWPGVSSPDFLIEDGTKDIDGNQEIWRFFDQQVVQSDDNLQCDCFPETYCETRTMVPSNGSTTEATFPPSDESTSDATSEPTL